MDGQPAGFTRCLDRQPSEFALNLAPWLSTMAAGSVAIVTACVGAKMARMDA